MTGRKLIIGREVATVILVVVVFAVSFFDLFFASKLDLARNLAERVSTVAESLSANVEGLDLSSPLVKAEGAWSLRNIGSFSVTASAQLGNIVTTWFFDMIDATARYFEDLYKSFLKSWGSFLGLSGSDKNSATSALPTDTEKLKEQIRQEVYDQLKKDLLSRPGFIGLSAFPASGSTSTDLSRQKSIEQMFSDKVQIVVSPDGRSGTVKPVLRDKLGGNYLFLLNTKN